MQIGFHLEGVDMIPPRRWTPEAFDKHIFKIYNLPTASN